MRFLLTQMNKGSLLNDLHKVSGSNPFRIFLTWDTADSLRENLFDQRAMKTTILPLLIHLNLIEDIADLG